MPAKGRGSQLRGRRAAHRSNEARAVQMMKKWGKSRIVSIQMPTSIFST